MPAGRANHKGTSDKPNVNANGQLNMNSAADKSVDPKDVLPEGITTNTTRTQEYVDFPPATQRPGEDIKEE
ncbi:hypothetical protein DSM106972_070060 [Dulcicalothrix desertica PCC 7102]|uniref:Uncharacterized protein n=1 Tax=Dulcicalothrix desertica PCC 7102 TaxID=232991 RepID=A0A433V4I6_9CYAN|nr:hypothetical protein [Dulcicalothrix desertica]RUT01000.1 hypothetical protein DSM106972_070060 [Dulcicalothrix desertica PCC 7102]TWH39225.1 hypothetical protein CAL7102_08441 [Dulcicalothrix desertica PCC 7102]